MDLAKAVNILENLENPTRIDITSKDCESIQEVTQKTTGISLYSDTIDEMPLLEDIEFIKDGSLKFKMCELLESIYSQHPEKKKSFNPKIFYNNWKLSIKFDNTNK